MSAGDFVVGLSAGFQRADGSDAFPSFDLTPLRTAAGVELQRLSGGGRISDAQTQGLDALILLGDAFDSASLANNGRLKLVARFGVGYDRVDIAACNSAGVAVSITPDGVRRPVAVAIITLMLALTGRLLDKDRLARLGGAGFARRGEFMGTGLEGKALGSVGIGNIGAEMFRLARPFGMTFLAHDPYADPQKATELGVALIGIDELFERADVLAVNCPLSPVTQGLVSRDRLRRMKPTAYLINTARGALVDQPALVEALQERWIAGAGLDVFEPEPPVIGDPILAAPNLIVTPHALSWTDQCFAAIGRSCIDAVLCARNGRAPAYLANPELFDGQRPARLSKPGSTLAH